MRAIMEVSVWGVDRESHPWGRLRAGLGGIMLEARGLTRSPAHRTWHWGSPPPAIARDSNHAVHGPPPPGITACGRQYISFPLVLLPSADPSSLPQSTCPARTDLSQNPCHWSSTGTLHPPGTTPPTWCNTTHITLHPSPPTSSSSPTFIHPTRARTVFIRQTGTVPQVLPPIHTTTLFDVSF